MFNTILRAHFNRYPLMQVQDVYKLVHQVTLGSEHAVPDHSTARKRLKNEAQNLSRGPLEPLIDPISADGEIIRVHLRLFTLSAGSIEMLLDAFLRTANNFHGTTGNLETYWDYAVQTHLWPATAMDAFIRPIRVQGYPAVQHSDTYQRHYKPAYRIVWRKYFPYREIGV